MCGVDGEFIDWQEGKRELLPAFIAFPNYIDPSTMHSHYFDTYRRQDLQDAASTPNQDALIKYEAVRSAPDDVDAGLWYLSLRRSRHNEQFYHAATPLVTRASATSANAQRDYFPHGVGQPVSADHLQYIPMQHRERARFQTPT